jgi:hypothetical protein
MILILPFSMNRTVAEWNTMGGIIYHCSTLKGDKAIPINNKLYSVLLGAKY